MLWNYLRAIVLILSSATISWAHDHNAIPPLEANQCAERALQFSLLNPLQECSFGADDNCWTDAVRVDVTTHRYNRELRSQWFERCVQGQQSKVWLNVAASKHNTRQPLNYFQPSEEFGDLSLSAEELARIEKLNGYWLCSDGAGLRNLAHCVVVGYRSQTVITNLHLLRRQISSTGRSRNRDSKWDTARPPFSISRTYAVRRVRARPWRCDGGVLLVLV